MKRYLSVLLFLCVLLTVLSMAACEKNKPEVTEPYVEPVYPPSEGLEFYYAKDSDYYILMGRGTCKDTRMVIPAEYEGKPVKGIAYESMLPVSLESNDIEEIIIPEGVTYIADNSFQHCTQLKSITFPTTLETIGEFTRIQGLDVERIYIKDLEKWMNVSGTFKTFNTDYYLRGKLLTNLQIPKGIKEIKDYAFHGCKSIKSVNIPEGVESIGYGAFMRCYNIESINMPNTLKTIGDVAFASCTGLESINLPDSVTSIGRGAFDSCALLSRVTLGKNLQSIGENAFSWCYSLFEVCNKSSLSIEKGSASNGSVGLFAKLITTNPSKSNLKKVGDYTFYISPDEAYLLFYEGQDINLILPDIGQQYEINALAFANIGNRALPDIESVVIPKSVTHIGHTAFYNCSKLKNVEIRAQIKSIENNTFVNCGALEEIRLPDSVTNIGESAFSSCWSLKSINIPDGVTKIGDDAFSACMALTSITIPSSVTELGKCAFSSCVSLRKVENLSQITSIGERTFYGCQDLIEINIPDTVTKIGEYAFSYCSSLYTITIPSNVTRIYNGAFDNCRSLIEVYYESIYSPTVNINVKNAIYNKSYSNLKYVGDFVFYDDGKEIYLVKYLGNDSEIILPEYEDGKEYKIFRYAFARNDTISSVVIPDGVIAIEEHAFESCDVLKSIIIPSSVEEIKWEVFLDTNELTIYCEAEEQPSGWDSHWNTNESPVVWGYKSEE